MTRNTKKTNETFSLPFYNCNFEQELNRLLRLNQFALFYAEILFTVCRIHRRRDEKVWRKWRTQNRVPKLLNDNIKGHTRAWLCQRSFLWIFHRSSIDSELLWEKWKQYLIKETQSKNRLNCSTSLRDHKRLEHEGGFSHCNPLGKLMTLFCAFWLLLQNLI